MLEKTPIVKDGEGGTAVIDDMNDTIDELKSQKKVKIMIPSSEQEKADVSIGINGYVYQIKRDEIVEVPMAVIEVLNNAKMSTYVQRKREDGEGNELVEMVVQRIPYQRY